MTVKDQLHILVDALPEKQAPLARRLLEALIEEANQYDEEPLTAEDIAAVEEAEKRIARGEFVTLSELRKRLDEAARDGQAYRRMSR